MSVSARNVSFSQLFRFDCYRKLSKRFAGRYWDLEYSEFFKRLFDFNNASREVYPSRLFSRRDDLLLPYPVIEMALFVGLCLHHDTSFGQLCDVLLEQFNLHFASEVDLLFTYFCRLLRTFCRGDG